MFRAIISPILRSTRLCTGDTACRQHRRCIIQSDSVARGPKLLSIKNYVIEIMT